MTDEPDSFPKFDTDIDALLQEVKESLDMSVPGIPLYRHPLYVGFPMPDDMAMPEQMRNFGMRGILTHKVAAFNKAVDERDWEQCLWLTERPFRTQFLHTLVHSCELVLGHVKAKLIKDAWIDSEGPHVNIAVWRHWFRWLHEYWVDSGEGDEPCPEVYTADELEARRKLIADKASIQTPAGTILVYRGTCSKEADISERGLSWTLSQEKAEWFAKRFARAGSKGVPLIFIGEVSVENTIGPWQSRGEDEMILPFGCTVMKMEAV